MPQGTPHRRPPSTPIIGRANKLAKTNQPVNPKNQQHRGERASSTNQETRQAAKLKLTQIRIFGSNI